MGFISISETNLSSDSKLVDVPQPIAHTQAFIEKSRTDIGTE